ncbi:MAG: hypothetical protein KDN20_24050 [Verrucomicrobiae bacterium]|nr:hypothetical protein [Verrucomicrobiae bacterium]
MSETSETIAWHYTTGINFSEIMEERVILPLDSYGSRIHKSVAWFSIAPQWESTAMPIIEVYDRQSSFVDPFNSYDENYSNDEYVANDWYDENGEFYPYDELDVGRRATMAETRRQFGGLFRFGLEKSALLPWRVIREAANIHPRRNRELIKSARELGANPAQWYGSLEPVSVLDCRIECEGKPGTWHELSVSLVNRGA